MRKIQFQKEYYYHIYNRGVDKRDVFLDDGDYFRFLRSMREMNNNSTDSQRDYEKRKAFSEEKSDEKKLSLGYPRLSFLDEPNLVSFIAYCLNPNHYHFLVKQKTEKGIERFMHKLGLGYTKYFNKKYNRSGSLFQGTYKAVAVKTDEQLQYTSAYINANYEIHKMGRADTWKWSSYQDYLNKRKGTLCDKNIILEYFDNNVKKYQDYIAEVVNNSKQIKEDIKTCLIEL